MTQDEQLDAKRLAVTWLRQARGFSDCPDQAVEALVAAGQMRKLSRGEVLVSRGQVFDRSGRLVASTAQEGLIRVVPEAKAGTPLHAKG